MASLDMGRLAGEVAAPAGQRRSAAVAAAGLKAEQTTTLFRNVAWGVIASAVGAGVLSGLLIRLGLLGWVRGAAWTLYVAACACAHLLLRRQHLRAASPRWRGWTDIFTAICLAEGLGWGWASVMLTGGDARFDARLIVETVTLAMAAGAIPAFSSYLPAFFAFFLPATLPYGLVSATAAYPLQQASTLLLVIYVVGMGGLGVITHRAFNALVALRIRASDLADDLRLEKESAERANLAKSSFLAAASHDLRQPIHAMGLFIGALRGMAMPAPALRLVEQIEASAAAMEDLFNGLLDISRFDAGVVEVRRQVFPIQALLDRVCHDHAEEAAAKGIVVRRPRCGALVATDPVLMERILRNLVSNAVRHTQAGRVLVGCRRGPTLSVEVWDTGPGIPAHLQDRVFEEYFQLANPERDRARGLGLGLAIVRRSADLLGSTLRVRSALGRGSCFSITLPLAPDGAAPTTAPPDDETHAAPRGVVAVVDDEPATLQAMDALLTSWGHQVVTAESGAAMLERLADLGRAPDLIVSDYRLRGGETGTQVIESVRSRYGASLPGLLITGDTAPGRLADARASGLPLLHKPVSKGKLRAAIGNLIAPALR